ncbi:hypothetical protein P175DRAFT_0527994 [Aspergillus ochraceoroseus IBT 24754]|uniref:Uncharacterized protein n=1 Tax=Aspergillus ochraceoroseus IBT 24754 TaxID=1392256 RepID=A0A2T5M7J5_9EURO|nr:uncharacterized protein P175DRAFT_0527994 [Aspergillus ochraceoroseus IBT 24754]PTU24510.1 hypothetical protein P175DRAFT_0527994 [Aspergillus ochraceoroseus IBT 24754]
MTPPRVQIYMMVVAARIIPTVCLKLEDVAAHSETIEQWGNPRGKAMHVDWRTGAVPTWILQQIRVKPEESNRQSQHRDSRPGLKRGGIRGTPDLCEKSPPPAAYEDEAETALINGQDS